jgi:adenylate cyclase
VQHPAERRRLTAILMADVVGYSRLMSESGAAALRSLAESRRMLDTIVQSCRGRVVGTQGDAFLAEFPSCADSVAAALLMQSALAERNSSDAAIKVEYRIGINLGDVYDLDGDIHGDGVNIAARLQSLAEPGSVVASGTVHDLLHNQIEAEFVFLGERELKNIAQPVRTYRVVRSGAAAGGDRTLRQGSGGREAAQAIARPCIAIEPFQSRGNGEGTRKICDMITDELIATLSQINSIQLHRGTHSVLGSPVHVPSIEHRYTLIGSATASPGGIKLNAQLVHSSSNAIVWGDRYAFPIEEAFAVQDHLARDIVSALQVNLTEGEYARLWSSGTQEIRAWELFQRGRQKERAAGPRTHRDASQLFKQSIALDPAYLAATVNLGTTLFDQIRFGWAEDRDRARRLLQKQLSHAHAINRFYPESYVLSAYLAVLDHRYEAALADMKRAVELAPGSPEFQAGLALVHVYIDDLESAIETYHTALRVNPYAPIWIASGLGMAYRRAGRLEEALEVLSVVVKSAPDYSFARVSIASTLVRLGRLEEARMHARELLRVEPEFRVDAWRRDDPGLNRRIYEEIRGDLRAAGLA